jgi:4'-phosphopantetheinyl transferase EntD
VICSLISGQIVIAIAEAADYDAPLHPLEARSVMRAVTSRRREFAAGRACARRALAGLGHPEGAIPVGARREPIWPPGIVGSITHTEGYCAAVTARAEQYRGLGIDAEQRRPVDSRTVAQFMTVAEMTRIPIVDDTPLPLLVFSAKEAFYKVFSPLFGTWLDYRDAEVSFDLDRGRFSVSLIGGQPLPDALDCRFAVTPVHVFTAVLLPARAPLH